MMTTYELNAWVAEYVMGWEYKENPHGWRLWFPLGKDVIAQKTIEDDLLPSFSTDRNFCAQAVAKIEEMALEGLYAETLVNAVMAKEKHYPDLSWITEWFGIKANPRQRCEAMYAIREQIVAARLKAQ